MEIITRSARMNDLPSLLKFEQGVINAERPFDPTLKHGAVYYDLKSMIEADHIEIVVAEKEGNLIGCGYARIESAPPYLIHDRYSYMAYMYVEPAHRRKGVNRLVIEALKKWSRAQGISELRLKVYDENHGAIKAYKKAGFKELAVEMRMDLSS